jgi:hypothetical protein
MSSENNTVDKERRDEIERLNVFDARNTALLKILNNLQAVKNISENAPTVIATSNEVRNTLSNFISQNKYTVPQEFHEQKTVCDIFAEFVRRVPTFGGGIPLKYDAKTCERLVLWKEQTEKK